MDAEQSRSRDMVLAPLLPIPPTIARPLPITPFDLLLDRMISFKMRRKMSILPSGSSQLGRNGTNILVIRRLVFGLSARLYLPKLTRKPVYRPSKLPNLELIIPMAKKRPRRCSICIRPRLEVENLIDHLLLNFLMLPCLRMLGLLLQKKRIGVVEVIDLDP